MKTQVLSTTFADRLTSFFEKNKDAVVVHEDDPKDTGEGGLQESGGESSTHKDEDGDGEEELKPLDASSKELSYRLCGNRVRRNFLRQYMLSVKGKKERVYMNDAGLMVSSIPYMKGTIDIELNLNGYFETFLVGRNAFTKIPFTFSLGKGGETWPDANRNNGRINGFPKDTPCFDMPIAEKHAVHWFAQGNKHRRLANIPLFQKQMLRWRDALVKQREDKRVKRVERQREIDEMIREARRLGYVHS